jgi:transposase
MNEERSSAGLETVLESAVRIPRRNLMTVEVTQAAYLLFVGVDIAARSFTAWWTAHSSSQLRALTFDQTPEGFASFQQRLTATGIAPSQTLIVSEATSSYWITLAVALHEAGYHVSVVNPKQIAKYAQSLPRRAKTDALDAQLIAQFAAERVPHRWTPPPQVYHELRQRLMARDALIEARKQLRNQRHALLQWPLQVETVQAQLDAAIAELTRRIVALEAEIAQTAADGAWAESVVLLQSIPGIGLLTAVWIVVLTLNFSACGSAASVVAYAGLAPMVRESGSSVRGRPSIGGGNARLRTALYMATLSAAQFNPQLRSFYTRLRSSGKPIKVARCATARKLLELAYAVVNTQTPFDPTYQRRVKALGS